MGNMGRIGVDQEYWRGAERKEHRIERKEYSDNSEE